MPLINPTGFSNPQHNNVEEYRYQEAFTHPRYRYDSFVALYQPNIASVTGRENPRASARGGCQNHSLG